MPFSTFYFRSVSLLEINGTETMQYNHQLQKMNMKFLESMLLVPFDNCIQRGRGDL